MIGRLKQLLNRTLDTVRVRLDERDRHRYNVAPLCAAPMGSREDYERLAAEARQRAYPPIDAYERAAGSAIETEWFHQLASVTQVAIKKSEICYQHGRLLYAALSRYIRGHAGQHLTIVESGTARGFSALCMAKALDDAGASGTIVTFDVLPHEVAILWNCIRDLEGPRTRASLLAAYAPLIERHVIFHQGDTKQTMARMSVPRVHMAFLDSVHTYDHVMAEFAVIQPRQRAGDILFFDDYTPDAYPGVVQAADEICRVKGYASTIVTANPRRRYLIAEKQ